MEETKLKYLHSIQQAGSRFCEWPGDFLLSVAVDLNRLCYTDRPYSPYAVEADFTQIPQNDYPRLFPP